MSKIPGAVLKPILAQFSKDESDFKQVESNVESLLGRVARDCSLVHSYKVRRKSRASLEDKLQRKWDDSIKNNTRFDISPDNLSTKFNDLVAGRILHLHTHEFGTIHSEFMKALTSSGYKLRKGFPSARAWDPEYLSYFKGLKISTPKPKKQTFYTSVHYELRMPGRKPERTFEVQIRTLAEELWGEIDHRFNYPHLSKFLSVREQISVLARATSAATRLVDAIVATENDEQKRQRRAR